MMDEIVKESDEIEPYWMKNWPEEVPRHIDYDKIYL